MKRINIFILFLFISLSINSNLLFTTTQEQEEVVVTQEPGEVVVQKQEETVVQEEESTAKQEGKFKRFKNSLVSFVKGLPGKAKTKIGSLNYDELEDLDFTFPMSYGKKEIPFGLKWKWEKGAGDVSTGFSKFQGELVSPSLGDLGLLPSATPDQILKIRLLNVLLGVGSKSERKLANTDLIKTVADPLKSIVGKKVLTTLQDILVLKPIYVFYIKLVLLSKTYIAEKKVKKIPNQIVLLLMRLLQTVNVEKTIEANNGEKDPRKWTKRVYYADPTEFIDVLPSFIKDTLNKINIPIPLDSYQEWKDKNTGLTDYDKQISETMRRANIDSEVKYAKENLQPMFKKTPITLTDAKMLSYLCASFVYNQSKAKRNDTTLFMGKFISKVIKAIKKISTKHSTYKASLITKLTGYTKLLTSQGKMEEQPVVDDFAIPGKSEVMIVKALAYYMNLLKSNMSYPFYGDKGYLYTDAKLGKNSTISYSSRIVFRVFNDLRKAARMAAAQTPDVIATDSKGNTIKIGKQAYKDIVGAPGSFDRQGNEVKAGSGPLFDNQKASIESRKASSILKQAVARFPKNDRRLINYRNKRDTARVALLRAKKNLALAKNKFMIRVLRYFKFKRAAELDKETEMKFLLREFKRLSMRSKYLIPLLSNINEFSKEILEIEIINTEDLEKEPEFEETFMLEEEEFSYDDMDDPFGEDDQFAF